MDEDAVTTPGEGALGEGVSHEDRPAERVLPAALTEQQREDLKRQVLQDSGVGETGAVRDLKKLTPTQQAGLWLAAGVGLAILGVIVFVAVVWFQTAPPPPTLPPPPALSDPAKAKDLLSNYQTLNQTALDNYKALNAEAISRVNGLFDLFATKALLPIFTAILGYIFGSRAADAGNSASE